MSLPHSCKEKAQCASMWRSHECHKGHFMNEKPDDHKSALKIILHAEDY